jgi:hypothetical protein
MAILVFRAHQKEVDFAIIHLQKLKKEMIIDETLGKDH